LVHSKSDESVHIEVKLPASVTDVWNAWTDPTLVLKWFGSDPRGVGLKASMDVRPGGKFEISFRGSDGIEHTCFGVYLEVEEPAELTFTWEWKSEPGVESLVTIVLTPRGENTQMQFEHAQVGSASAHDYLTGWTLTFDKLKNLLRSH
jgi:uncharacterized protein YndB with AHSA1/START domain